MLAFSPLDPLTSTATDRRLPQQLRPVAMNGSATGEGSRRQHLGIFGNRPMARPVSNAPAPQMGAAASTAPANPPVPVAGAQRMGPLGGSMRQPFDYGAALRAMMPEEDKRSGFQKAAGVLGPMLLSLGGNSNLAGYLLQQNLSQRQNRAEQTRKAYETVMGWQRDDYAAQRDADLQAADPFTIGRNRLLYNPATGQVDTLYTGAQDFELYAQQLGLVPGTPAYAQAMEDYVLRSSGPSAHQRDIEMDDHRTVNDERLDDHRTANDRSLEGYRQRNRVNLEGMRQGNRIELRGIPQARASSSRSSSRSGSRVTVREGEPTATGSNGETLVVRDGKWVAAE